MTDRFLDISVVVTPGTPEWPGDTPFDCRWAWAMRDGASVNVSAVSGSPHVGTHADAPLHVRDEAPASETLPLLAFDGPCLVVDVSDRAAPLGFDALAARATGGAAALGAAERILLRTGRTIADGRFPDGWATLTPECAAALAAHRLLLLGTDAPSVDERESKALAVHHALFGGGAQVLENLDLRLAAPGPWTLRAMPVRWAGLDAVPVRAVLLRAPDPGTWGTEPAVRTQFPEP